MRDPSPDSSLIRSQHQNHFTYAKCLEMLIEKHSDANPDLQLEYQHLRNIFETSSSAASFSDTVVKHSRDDAAESPSAKKFRHDSPQRVANGKEQQQHLKKKKNNTKAKDEEDVEEEEEAVDAQEVADDAEEDICDDADDALQLPLCLSKMQMGRDVALQDMVAQLVDNSLYITGLHVYHGMGEMKADRRKAVDVIYDCIAVNARDADKARVFLGVMAKRDLPQVKHLPRDELVGWYDVFVGGRERFKFWDDIEEMMVDPQQTLCAFDKDTGYVYDTCTGDESRFLQRYSWCDIKRRNAFYWRGECLTSIPKEIGLCTALQVMLCSSNKLCAIPVELTHCTQLQYVSIFNNRLRRLPRQLGRCRRLEYFDCGENDVTSLPAGIGNCLELKYLYCHDNKISDLPLALGKCRKLERFLCHKNNLGGLPVDIGKCTKLRYVKCPKRLRESPGGTVEFLTNVMFRENRQFELAFD